METSAKRRKIFISGRKLTIFDLPNECLELILNFLDQASQTIARFVCSQWNLLIIQKKSQPFDLLNFIIILKKSVPNDNFLKLLVWTKENGCSCNDFIVYFKEVMDDKNYGEIFSGTDKFNHTNIIHKLAIRAIELDNLEFLEWAHQTGFPLIDQLSEIAAFTGHLKILQWLVDHHRIINDRTFISGIKGKQLEILQFLNDKVNHSSIKFCDCAAFYGRLEILQWLQENGYLFDIISISQLAAEGGHLKILKWLFDGNGSIEKTSYFYAAKTGQIKILEWLNENDSFMNIHDYCHWITCIISAYTGQFETLKWLHQIGCHLGIDTVYAAKEGNHPEIIKWLEENNLLDDGKQGEDCVKKNILFSFLWYPHSYE